MIKHLTLVGAGGIVGILLFTFVFYNEPELWISYNYFIFGAAIVGVILAYLLQFSSRLLDRAIAWQQQPGFSLLVTILVGSVLTDAVTAGYVSLYATLLDETVGEGVYLKLVIVNVLVVLLYSTIRLLIKSNHHLQQSQIDHVKLETRQIDLQLIALKAQLSPHFLFNSLNTISSLIHQNLEASENYIRNLAAVYQYTLPSYEKTLVSFGEEWSFVKANLDLIQVRFGKSLTVTVEEDTNIRAVNMPPLTLQLLLENALKHNQIDQHHPLQVRISRKGSWWSVSNNLTKAPSKVHSFQVGLGNIKERYQLLSQKAIQVTTGQEFSVKLPVL